MSDRPKRKLQNLPLYYERLLQEVYTSTEGEGDAGAIKIHASGNISAEGADQSGSRSGIFSIVVGVGNAGGINITTTNLKLTQGGQVNASTFEEGDTGAVTIKASDTISVDGFISGIFSTVGADQFLLPVGASIRESSLVVGNARGINITTANLELTKGGQVNASTFGAGNAGAITIEASDTISVEGEGPDEFNRNSGIFSTVGTRSFFSSLLPAVGNAGGINITTANLSLTQGGQVSASTEGEGNAGMVTINASGTISAEGENQFGSNSGIFSIVDESGVGKAGGINLTTSNLELTQGGEVSASTLGEKDAGDVTVNARESISISGVTEDNRSGISADAFISSGKGGDVNVFTNRLTLDDGGTIEAGNFDSLGVFAPGTGEPGDITIKANSLSLSNQASIEAATQSEIGDNANINLTIAEDIILRNNSLISATAFENADGGNVTINADDGSIVAFPNQNNDIIANAEQGNGGNIDITTQAIFGLEERPSTPPNQTNDIDASSEFGLQGSFSRNTPEVDPTSGLIELPEAVGDASDQISQNPCEQGVGSEFTIIGKGGIPPNPNETLNSNAVKVGLVEPVPSKQKDGGEEINLGENGIRPENPTAEVVPAQGWIFNEKGEVMLTAYQTTDITTQRDRSTPNSCSALKQK